MNGHTVKFWREVLQRAASRLGTLVVNRAEKRLTKQEVMALIADLMWPAENYD